MAEKMKHQPGQPDYGHNNPTGGTNENEGNLNPQGPTSGTENYHPDRKDSKQSGAPTDLNHGTSASAGQHSFRCADAGFSDCRWEASMSSSDRLWDEIHRHAGNAHGIKSLDEKTKGKIQDAIHVRRAA